MSHLLRTPWRVRAIGCTKTRFGPAEAGPSDDPRPDAGKARPAAPFRWLSALREARSDRLHLRQVVADGFRAAADAGVKAGEGLRYLGEVQRQVLDRHVAAAAQRIAAEPGVLELVGQKRLDLALG